LCSILFKSALKNEEFLELQNAGINQCIIGESKEQILFETLSKMWDSHWKRVPESLIEEAAKPLNSRVLDIIQFIENHSLEKCNVKEIASHVAMSESYFRKEFKKYFNVNFREFKAKLINHYESQLLFENQLKPHYVSAILNYKNISSYSRSFKNRNGSTWQNKAREFSS